MPQSWPVAGACTHVEAPEPPLEAPEAPLSASDRGAPETPGGGLCGPWIPKTEPAPSRPRSPSPVVARGAPTPSRSRRGPGARRSEPASRKPPQYPRACLPGAWSLEPALPGAWSLARPSPNPIPTGTVDKPADDTGGIWRTSLRNPLGTISSTALPEIHPWLVPSGGRRKALASLDLSGFPRLPQALDLR